MKGVETGIFAAGFIIYVFVGDSFFELNVSEGGFVNEAHTKRGLLRFAADILLQRSMSYFVPDVVLIDDK